MHAYRNRISALALCLATVISPTAQAQTQTPAQINLYGISDTIGEHLAKILDGSFWDTAVQGGLEPPRQSRSRPESLTPTQLYLDECDNARRVWRAPQSANPARERRDAIRTFRNCVENERALMIARDTESAPEVNASLQPLLNALDEDNVGANNQAQFMGVSFGVGIGVSSSHDDRISQAEVGADGNLRALSDETQEPRVILESHYYGWCKSDKCNEGKRGIGPFFGIVAKDDKLISAFALGVMFGWKETDDTKRQGFSIGFGAILESDVSSLADGFEIGQPLPAGEVQPAFTKESRWGTLLFFTRTF